MHATVTTAAGGPGQAASTTFTIAHQVSVSQKEFPNNPGDPRAIQHYVSAPTLTPSTVRITTPAKSGASPGDLFLAPYQGMGSPGPMIAEQNGVARVVSPAALRRGVDQLPGAAVSGQASPDLVAGTHPRGWVRSGRERHLRHLLPSRSPISGPATATKPICTRFV